eukprot:9483242-Heterocapsa_arctica.AAC.1
MALDIPGGGGSHVVLVEVFGAGHAGIVVIIPEPSLMLGVTGGHVVVRVVGLDGGKEGVVVGAWLIWGALVSVVTVGVLSLGGVSAPDVLGGIVIWLLMHVEGGGLKFISADQPLLSPVDELESVNLQVYPGPIH